MPYKLKFKNKFTKNRWVVNVNAFKTKRDANSTAKYIKNQHDAEGKKVKTEVKISKVVKPKKRKRKK
ncbi:MAG: hypothetical protein ACTSRU_01830 [Candidatus Hodarchaeales archaeon]